ncbi:MAG: SGNH/GDSL hydrolase family protein [Colwellia sp.]|nr:SGNH/GDSL hydrolase family protein [Colwellia sp.]
MAIILCFGDSNTWGTIPQVASQTTSQAKIRYDENERWTALLQKSLKDKHHVIEEGQPSRTVVHNAPFEGSKTGIRYLKDCLAQYEPELVIIMLGTNDLKKRFFLSPEEISLGISSLIKQALGFSQQQYSSQAPLTVLLISPPIISEMAHYAKMYAGGAEKSKQLAQHYRQCADELNCTFVDANTIISSSRDDGVHWQVDQHQLFANALLPIIETLMNDEYLQ